MYQQRRSLIKGRVAREGIISARAARRPSLAMGGIECFEWFGSFQEVKGVETVVVAEEEGEGVVPEGGRGIEVGFRKPYV